MPKPALIITKPKKTIFGKKQGGWIAHLAADEHWQAEGPNAEEALKNLEKALALVARHAHTRRYLFAGQTVFVLYHTFGGWSYDIVKPGQTGVPSGCGMGEIGLEKAFEQMKQHVEQYDAA